MAKSIEETEFSAENHEDRHSEGREGTKFTSPSASPKKGKLMPRKNTAAGDPAITNPGVRANAPYQGERKGAAYSIKATYMKQTAPEAGMTQANGRIVSPSIVRQKDSWSQGMESSY